MNGYVIAILRPGEAEEVFAKPQVRHVAEMSDGTTFVAFDGDVPIARGMILEAEPVVDDIPWARPQVRHTIKDDRPENIALYTAEEAVRVHLMPEDQVTFLMADLVLLLSYGVLGANALWSATSERILDKRLSVGV